MRQKVTNIETCRTKKGSTRKLGTYIYRAYVHHIQFPTFSVKAEKRI